jgi:HSP20 family protein
MPVRDLITRAAGKRGLPMRREDENPFYSLQREMNKLMENFFGEGALGPALSDDFAGDFLPKVDLREEDQAFVVSAELPGMEEKDVEVLLSGDALTIKGEKKQEKEEKGQNYHRIERHYGSFNRIITLPAEVLTDKVEASFEKGILKITLPKAEKKPEAKKIPIKG